MIERFDDSEVGYTPVLVSDKWQIAYLNHHAQFSLQSIDSLERHNKTDEVFLLMKGQAWRITAEESAVGLRLIGVCMKESTIYNVVKGSWHAVVTTPQTHLIIVENKDTHLLDVEYQQLIDKEKDTLREIII